MTATVTVPQIRKAMAIIARAIETRPEGEKYWPIFERLERELAMREDRAARLAAALAYEDPENAKKKAAKRIPVSRTTNPLYAAIFASWEKDEIT